MQNEINAVNQETIQALARANGLHLPDARLGRVLKQYQTYLQLLARLDSFDLKMEAEPAEIFTLVPEIAAPMEPHSRRAKGETDGNR